MLVHYDLNNSNTKMLQNVIGFVATGLTLTVTRSQWRVRCERKFINFETSFHSIGMVHLHQSGVFIAHSKCTQMALCHKPKNLGTFIFSCSRFIHYWRYTQGPQVCTGLLFLLPPRARANVFTIHPFEYLRVPLSPFSSTPVLYMYIYTCACWSPRLFIHFFLMYPRCVQELI